MEIVTGLHRKSLRRLMGQDLARRPRRRQRGPSYGHRLDPVLRAVAEAVDYVCAERLQPNLVWLAKHLAQQGELTLAPDQLHQLARMSVSTPRRRLQRLSQDQPRLPRRRPQPANRSLRDVPMRRIPWDEPRPGHFEVDLVHHCGPSGSGQYVHTLQMVDVATGWSERAASLGRSFLAVGDAFQRILARLPFPLLEVHPDNGSELFNKHLRRFWQDRYQAVQFSRFFQPVLPLQEKTILPSVASPVRIRRKFDKARTPFDRLCATGILPSDVQAQPETLRNRTNPRQLRREIYRLIDHVLRLSACLPAP